jgi:hypothetical protein
MSRGRRNRLLPVLKSESAATDLDLISYLKAIPDARMRRGVRIPPGTSFLWQYWTS